MTAEHADPAESRQLARPHGYTPLNAVHVEAGAAMTDFAGWWMPLRYGSETGEHRAVRTTAGLFDLSHMGEIEFSGPEACAALDRALVSDIAAIKVGRAKYTMICRADGGILDDLIVYRLNDQHYLVVANAANAELVLAEFRERAVGFETQVHDRGATWALLAVQGPRSSTILTELTEIDLIGVRYYAISDTTVAGRRVLLARTGYTGEDGFEIFCAPDDAVGIWSEIRAAGEPYGLVPAGLACRDTLRLEAGMPLYGHELSAQLTPYAAGLGRVVALGKTGDFVGRSALARIADQPPARVLVGLTTVGRRVPRAGYAVLDASSGHAVGDVTSGAPSPLLGQPIAMAYLDRCLAASGTAVLIDIRGQHELAHVTDLPFYRRR